MVIDIYDYGRIVHDATIKWQLIEISQEVIKNASNTLILDDAKTQVEILEGKIYDLANENVIKCGFVSSSQIASEVLDNINQIIKNPSCLIGISTGFMALSKKLCKFEK